jgi:stage V sporulation protein D (sporulation-specific penicillin-binding protein)
MAAPTVGAVMADILPYLGVKQSFTEEDLAGKAVVVEDFTDMEVKNAEKLLKNQNLSARIIGTGEFVTAQIPAPGETVPGGSEVLLYLGEVPEETPVKVPDFLGMNRQQAADAAGELGLYILVSGNQAAAPNVVVTAQSISGGAEVPVGTTIRLEFADTTARD